MRNAETAVIGDGDRVHVHIQEEGAEIVLYFPDWSGDGEVMRLEINPRRTNASLTMTAPDKVERTAQHIDTSIVRRVGRNYPTYVEYARSVIRWNHEETREALIALGKTGKTKRGLSADFVSGIAAEYRALVANDEPYPVKALAEMHNVVISTASRWISKAAQMDLLDDNRRNKP